MRQDRPTEEREDRGEAEALPRDAAHRGESTLIIMTMKRQIHSQESGLLLKVSPPLAGGPNKSQPPAQPHSPLLLRPA